MHLIGITCIYIASKQNDIYHISLRNIFERVAHKKYTVDQIKEKESEILSKKLNLAILDFNVTFPTTLKFLNRTIQKNFIKDTSFTLNQINANAKMVLKMCLYDDKMADIKPLHLAVAISIYSLK